VIERSKVAVAPSSVIFQRLMVLVVLWAAAVLQVAAVHGDLADRVG
jgi:hypothetical protein